MGAPKGNKFASHDKPWTNALQRVLAQLEVKDADGKIIAKAGEALRLIAEETVRRAMAGDKDARQEIANRMDGKPTEFLDVNHRRDPAMMSTDELAAEIARERASESSKREAESPSVH